MSVLRSKTGVDRSRRDLPCDTHEISITLAPGRRSVLTSLAEAVGGIPRILLRDTDSTKNLRPSSTRFSQMPSADRSGRYQFLGEIARGGMGAILRGRDTELGRNLAVKVLLESHKAKPDLVRRFAEEAQIGGQLQHPGVVPIYDLGTFGDLRPFFTMKLVEESWRTHLGSLTRAAPIRI